MKGLAFSIIGIAIFTVMFVNFLPPMKAKEPAKNSVSEIVKPENESVDIPAPSSQSARTSSRNQEAGARIFKAGKHSINHIKGQEISFSWLQYYQRQDAEINDRTSLEKGYKPCGVCETPSSPVTVAPNLDFEVYGN